jgi:hypothetical protein
MTTAQEVEDWRVKIKKKIWSEFAAEPNEAHGKFLMKKFDELCDTALLGMLLRLRESGDGTPETDALKVDTGLPQLEYYVALAGQYETLARSLEKQLRAVRAVADREAQLPFWVIEQFTDGQSSGYWDGGSSRSFVAAIDKAVQFCRKEDAATIKRGWHWQDCQITEHLMLNGRQK